MLADQPCRSVAAVAVPAARACPDFCIAYHERHSAPYIEERGQFGVAHQELVSSPTLYHPWHCSVRWCLCSIEVIAWLPLTLPCGSPQLRKVVAVGCSCLCDVATGGRASMLCLAIATYAEASPGGSVVADTHSSAAHVPSWVIQVQVQCCALYKTVHHCCVLQRYRLVQTVMHITC